jgi:hypothetical protein
MLSSSFLDTHIPVTGCTCAILAQRCCNGTQSWHQLLNPSLVDQEHGNGNDTMPLKMGFGLELRCLALMCQAPILLSLISLSCSTFCLLVHAAGSHSLYANQLLFIITCHENQLNWSFPTHQSLTDLFSCSD